MLTNLNQLSLKFIAIVVPIVTLCAVLFLGLFVYLKYGQLQAALDAKITLIADSHALAVAEPLWALNYDSMYRNIGTMTTHPEVLCVEVIDSFKNITYHLPQRDCARYSASENVLQTSLQFNNERIGDLIVYYTTESIQQSMLQELEIGGLLFFLFVTAMVITALIALRIIIGIPLQHLLNSIRGAERGNERRTVQWSSGDELGQVVSAYNAMIRHIDQREADLQATMQQAEQASQTKSAFLANISHELRNPMNVIIGFSRIVLRKADLDSRQRDNMQKILSSAEHLLSLINNILDLSKIEAGHMEVRRVSFAPVQTIGDCVNLMEPLIKSKGLSLQVNIQEGLPMLYSDEEKLRQILLNLLSNAAKFTPQGSISIAASRQSGIVAIAVGDSGIGIPPDKLETIFEEFKQLDSGSTKEYAGTGLGLSICRLLAELLGGTIEVQSKPEHGSTFTIRLPLTHTVPESSKLHMTA
ncbi:MAG: hypothetical protein KDK04_05600 [Candidatus Competibacteraceae bacterium]|nr:hypothetical protein [Candidatus Competibacteraceae bacterium]MCB1811183.1 hypothetical protein [Candidatus Competibacteraceae bacterium]